MPIELTDRTIKEQRFLGALMMSEEAQQMHRVTRNDFQDTRCRFIYGAIAECIKRGRFASVDQICYMLLEQAAATYAGDATFILQVVQAPYDYREWQTYESDIAGDKLWKS